MARRTDFAALLATALGASSLLVADLANAGSRWRAQEQGDTVTAVSRFGNGTITAPVRPARFGYEVRLPRGTWVACRRGCAETLRVETVDLLENDGSLTGYGTAMNECGIFGCIEWRRRW
jgi:hypothetical protein